jgi:hypothetical protein
MMATNYGLLSGEDAVSRGLGQAAGLMDNYTSAAYPSFVPSQTTAPSQQNYMNYTPNQPMAQVQTPNYKLNSATPTWQNTNLQKYAGTTPTYQGLMGGDYAALQQALTTPGEIAAKTAYDQGQVNLTNQMGGNGLYGSSIMANQARNALDTPYMNALATNAANAAAQRYGMQATDLQNQNAFEQNIYNQQVGENTAMQGLMSTQGLAQNAQNLNVYGQQMAQNQNENAYNMDAAKLGMQQNQNVYEAGVNDAARQQDYNLAAQTYANQGTEAQRQWQNQQALEQMQYQLASGQYSNQQQTDIINQYLALAGRGQVTAGQNAATNSAQSAQDAAAQSSMISGLLNAGVSAATIYAMFGGG